MARILVSGPPCAGKSTWAQENADGAEIIDRDQIAREMSGSDGWSFPPDVTSAAEAEFWRRVEQTRDESDVIIVRSVPGAERRAALARELGADVQLLRPQPDEALARARRDGRPSWTNQAIRSWYVREARN